jgi:ACS family tartrate transporter-like MFS transporter
MSEDRVFMKCAWRLIPFMAVLYFVNFLDRVNVGFAALTMNRDLGFSPTVYGFGAGAFFVGYFLCEVPSNVILARVGARFWIFRIMATWGVMSAACALIQGTASFVALRFLLGIAEAGFYPGMLLYLTYWFPKRFRAQFAAGFIAAAPLATVIGGPLSGFVLGLDGAGGLRGWQWLFLLEGAPAFLLAFAVLKFLPDGPHSATWLTAAEKKTITERLADEDSAGHREFWSALRDPRVLVLALVIFGTGFARFGIGLWLPLIVQGMGFSNLQIGFVVAAPYVVASVAMILWGRSSDKRNERTWHIAAPVLVAASGLIFASLTHSDLLLFAALACAVVCIEATQGPFWSLPSLFLGGTAAAGGIGLIAATGQSGAFFGSSIMGVLRDATGDYTTGMAVLAGALTMSAIAILALGRVLARPAAMLQPNASTGA